MCLMGLVLSVKNRLKSIWLPCEFAVGECDSCLKCLHRVASVGFPHMEKREIDSGNAER